jgi:hypothetical protein
MNKKVPLWFVLLLLWVGCIITVTFGWQVWRISNYRTAAQKNASISILIASFPHLIHESFRELKQPNPLIKSSPYPSIHGFKSENNYVDSNYLLLPTYDKKENQSVVKLIRLADQKVIYEWKPDFDQIKKIPFKENNGWQKYNKSVFNTTHPLLSPDGSVVFHSLESPLVKIDKNSKILWILNGGFNHSLEHDAEGDIWVASTPGHSKSFSFLDNYDDNAITKVSPNGKILFKKSVAEILLENGYRGLLLGTGGYSKDLIHINDIQPALSTTNYWMKDDLLISLRSISTVLLYRPATNKIIWLKTGPWLRQHDVDFIDSRRIGVFGNNIIQNELNVKLIDGHNEEYIYDFKTDAITTPYTEFLKNAKVSTPFEGRSDILANGDLFIEETGKFRLLRGDSKSIKWQFVSSIDQSSVSALSWTRFISKEEFNKLTFLK